jgi:hypothetical protein
MGLVSDTPDLYTFECCSCLATYTGRPHELTKLGWVRKEYKRKGSRTPREILLCDDCSKRFEAIWHPKKAA